MTLSRTLTLAAVAITLSTATGSTLLRAGSPPSSTTQPTGPMPILGVDHVGLTVPDMDQAVRFFDDVLGCTPVTHMGGMPLDPAWKDRYHIRPAAELKQVVMLRAGTGANLELFEYRSPGAAKRAPFDDDPGFTHVAFPTRPTWPSAWPPCGPRGSAC